MSRLRGVLTPGDVVGLDADALRRARRDGWLLPVAGAQEGEAGGEGEGGGEGGTEGDGEGAAAGQEAAASDKQAAKLRAEAAKYRTELREAQAKLKEIEDRDKSESEKATERATAAEQKVADLEAKQLRVEVAEEKGLTLTQARRLVGTTKDELLKDADQLLEDLGATPASRGHDGGPRGRRAGGGSMDDLIRHRAGVG